MCIRGLHKNMRPIGSQAIEAYMPFRAKEKRVVGSRTSKGRKTVCRKMRK